MKEVDMGLLRLCSKKEDGNMSTKYSSDASFNRELFLERHEIDKDCCIFLQPSNSDVIVALDQKMVQRYDSLYSIEIEADALVCDIPGVMVYLNFGDCIPFTVYDVQKRVFVFAHLGWKSVYLDLHLKIVTYLMEHYGSLVQDLRVYVGPSIKAASYVFQDSVQVHDPRWKNYVALEPDGYHISLDGYIKGTLQDMGVSEENILVSPVDTGSDLSYFSNYRYSTLQDEEAYGRFFYGSMMI